MTPPVTTVSRPAPEPFEGRPPRSPAVRWLKQKLYPPRQSRYEALVRMTAATARRVLTFGAGRGAREFDLRAPGREVVGVDVDRDVLENPYVDRAVIYDGRTLPFPSRAALPSSPSLRFRTSPRLRCCRLPTCPATPSRSTSPTGW